MERIYRLAVVNSHPIQYFAPLYRRLSRDPRVELMVYFMSARGVEAYHDDQFGATVRFDAPLVDGYPHRFLPNVRRSEDTLGFFRPLNPTIPWEFLRHRYDAVWVNGHNLFSSLLAIASARILRMPVLTRGDNHLGLRRSGLMQALRRPAFAIFYRLVCNAHLATGTRNREFLLAQGVAPERIFLAPFSVDNDYFRERALAAAAGRDRRRAELGLPPDLPVVLYASKLMRRKRPEDLLEAFRRLRERGARAALLFVGSGEMEAELVKRAESQGIPDVHFLGFRNQSELPALYALSDVFALPAQDEPWGLVINEVMCAGLPVVATEEVGAVADLVHDGRNGFTYPTGDVERLSEHLERLVRDPDLRARQGSESQRIVSGWSIEACVEGVVSALAWLDREGRLGRRRSARRAEPRAPAPGGVGEPGAGAP